MDVNMDLRDILEFFFFRKRKNDWFYFTILYIFYKNNIKIFIKWLIINVNIHYYDFLFIYTSNKEVLCGIIIRSLCMRHQENSIDYDKLNLRVETFN